MELLPTISIAIIFFSTILLQVVRKNFTFAMTYVAQSIGVIGLVALASIGNASIPLIATIVLMFVIKVVVAPRFFTSLIAKHGIKFSGTTYLSLPLTLVAIALLVVLAHSDVFLPLTAFYPPLHTELALSVAAMLLSFLLIANRRGTISQMIGVLSLENSIVTFAVLIGLEQSPLFEAGILFDLFVWIFIASSFASMVYEHTGSVDPTVMKRLHE